MVRLVPSTALPFPLLPVASRQSLSGKWLSKVFLKPKIAVDGNNAHGEAGTGAEWCNSFVSFVEIRLHALTEAILRHALGSMARNGAEVAMRLPC